MWMLNWMVTVAWGRRGRGSSSLEWRHTYLGDIVVVALHISEAKFLRGADIPVCWLMGFGFDDRAWLFLSWGLKAGPDTFIE